MEGDRRARGAGEEIAAGRIIQRFKAAANAGGQYQLAFDLKSPTDLYIPADSANVVLQAFYFAGEFGDRFKEAIVDVSLRDLLLRMAKKGFGAGYGHVRARVHPRPAMWNDCHIAAGTMSMARINEFSRKISGKNLATLVIANVGILAAKKRYRAVPE